MNTFVDTMRSLLNGAAANGRIERCCAQLQWPIDERSGDRLILHFRDSVVGRRNLYINGGDEPVVLFSAFSHAVLDEGPEELLGYLLKRNSELVLGKWGASTNQKRQVLFSVDYQAIGDGLTAPAVKYIADQLINEANDFDAKMVRLGLLRP